MTTSEPTGPPPGDTRPPADPLAAAGGTAGSPGATGLVSAKKPRRRGRAVGLGLTGALLVFVTVVLVLFVLFNTQTVDVSLVFGHVRAPLVIALVVAAGLGGLLVGLAAAVGRARRSRRSDRTPPTRR